MIERIETYCLLSGVLGWIPAGTYRLTHSWGMVAYAYLIGIAVWMIWEIWQAPLDNEDDSC